MFYIPPRNFAFICKIKSFARERKKFCKQKQSFSGERKYFVSEGNEILIYNLWDFNYTFLEKKKLKCHTQSTCSLIVWVLKNSDAYHRKHY